MNKAQALQKFWSSFNIPAIDEVSAYDLKDKELLALGDTYITYEAATDEIDNKVSLSASVWDRTTSWAAVTDKVEEISRAISYGGVTVPYDGGALWITRGSPFAQRTIVEENYDYRRIIININAEYLSA